MHRRRARNPRRLAPRRRYRNGAGGAVLGAVLPYAIGGVVLYFAWTKYGGALGLLNTKPQNPATGSSNTGAANTVGQLITNPGNEVQVLATDASNAASGVSGLVSNAMTSAENGLGQLWAKL